MSEIPSDFDPRLEPAGASDESIQRVHAGLLHTKPEPEPGGYELTPLLLLGFMSGLILACCIFFVHNRGGFDSLVYNGHLNGVGAISAELTDVQIIAHGKSLYGQTCIQCHQATGQGVPLSYPPLAGSDIVQGDPERLIRIVLDGLKDPIMLNGEQRTFPNKMPPFSPGMPGGLYNWSDAKISYVLSYVRQEWGNKAGIITADDVTAVHAKIADRKVEWTMKELPAATAP
jgi:mono/diheme cytochrome c family protein